MKRQTMLYLDMENVLKAKENHLNMSEICNEAIAKAVADPEAIERKEQALDEKAQEIQRLREGMANQKIKEQTEYQSKVDDFLNNTGSQIIYNPEALKHWEKKLKLSTDQLVKLKKTGKL